MTDPVTAARAQVRADLVARLDAAGVDGATLDELEAAAGDIDGVIWAVTTQLTALALDGTVETLPPAGGASRWRIAGNRAPADRPDSRGRTGPAVDNVGRSATVDVPVRFTSRHDHPYCGRCGASAAVAHWAGCQDPKHPPAPLRRPAPRYGEAATPPGTPTTVLEELHP